MIFSKNYVFYNLAKSYIKTKNLRFKSQHWLLKKWVILLKKCYASHFLERPAYVPLMLKYVSFRLIAIALRFFIYLTTKRQLILNIQVVHHRFESLRSWQKNSNTLAEIQKLGLTAISSVAFYLFLKATFYGLAFSGQFLVNVDGYMNFLLYILSTCYILVIKKVAVCSWFVRSKTY